jgi:hypothetical protein
VKNSLNGMTNPSLLELLAKGRQPDLVTATHVRRLHVSVPGKLRKRFGWFLFDLGTRLMPDGSAAKVTIRRPMPVGSANLGARQVAEP